MRVAFGAHQPITDYRIKKGLFGDDLGGVGLSLKKQPIPRHS